jgi:hypothetical protein
MPVRLSIPPPVDATSVTDLVPNTIEMGTHGRQHLVGYELKEAEEEEDSPL